MSAIKILLGEQIVGEIETMSIYKYSGSDNVKIEPARMRFDKLKIKKAFNNDFGFVIPAEQVHPFDIVINDTHGKVDCRINNAWFDYPATKMLIFESWGLIFVEGATMQAESMV